MSLDKLEVEVIFQLKLIPIRIELSDSLENRIKFIQCSLNISCAVTVDGRAYLWGKINGQKTVIPKLIQTDVKKIIMNFDRYYFLTMSGELKYGFEKSLVARNVQDIFGTDNDILGIKIIFKSDSVYEVNEDNNTIVKTNYSKFL